MNHCVPSWDIEKIAALPLGIIASKTQSKIHDISTPDYEVAELTWKDGHLGMHAFGVPRLPTETKENIYSPAANCSWEKPLAGGTLESIVNQATTIPSSKSGINARNERLVSWFDNGQPPHVPESSPVITTTCLVGSSTLVGSCSVAPTSMEEGKEVRVARLTHDWSSRIEQSISGSGTIGGRESRQASHDTWEREVSNTTGFTSSTSLDSPGNTSSAKTTVIDELDSIFHCKNQRGGDTEEDKKKVTAKLSILGKRSRCASVHNQSERKRRDKINQRLSILQKLVPNSSKTDKASMLDEVIEYMKQLQGTVEMMNRMNMSSMMLPLALQQQQQLQMSIMSPMGMGSMNMGLGVMDMNTMTRPGMPQGFYPNPFMTMPQSTSSIMPADPLSTSFLPSQISQPSMTMEAYSRMAAMYQQFQAQAATATTNSKTI